MTLPSEVQRLALTVEVAWGADLSKGFLSWPWSDESARLDAQTVTVRRGRSDWGARVQPTGVGFELANLDGRLTPGSPMSPLWPNVERNTPCRLLLSPGTTRYLLTDGDLTNNATTADDSSLDITSDIDLRYDGDINWFRGFPVSGGGSALVGKYKAANDNRSYLLWTVGGLLVVSWSTDGTNANAQSIFATRPLPWHRGRHAVRGTFDVDNGSAGKTVTFYTAPTQAGPWTQLDQVVTSGTTSIHAGSGSLEVGVVTGETTAPPLGKTYGATVIAGLAGTDVRANPDFAAQAVGTTAFTDPAGRSWTLAGDAEITNRRVWFFGQVDEIEPVWPHGDLSGPDPATQPGEARVTISASGVLRRLGKRNKPLHSTLYRAATSPLVSPGVIAYWPTEDESAATSFASPIPGVAPMAFGGEVRPAADATLAASKPLAQIPGGQPGGWSGIVPLRQTSQWLGNISVRIPTPGATEIPLLTVNSAGTVPRWVFSVTSTAIILRGFDALGTELFEDAPVPTDFFAGWTQLSLDVRQEGTDIRRGVLWMTATDRVIGFSTTSPGTMGPVSSVANLMAAAPTDGISFGHIAVTTGVSASWLGWDTGANKAYVGEPAAVRLQRLGREEGLAVTVIGDPAATEPMGPQRPRALLNLFEECADVDLGILHETRDTLGPAYRTRASIYNQDPVVVLDAARNEIVNPFAPVLDDQSLSNDVTVTRDGGSSARRTTDPEPAPAESEEAAVTVNAATDTRLDQLAAWRLHLGTWPGMRYRSVSSELTVAPRLMDLWPDVDLGDRVQVVGLPPQHPTDVVDLLVEGYADPRSPTRWTPQLNCSPAGPWTVGVLDDDTPTTSLARLDTAGTVLRDPINDTATTLVVAQTGSYLQLTGAAGARATTPDHSSFAITDLDVRFEATFPVVWIPPAGNSFEILGQNGATLAWMVSINDQGRPWLRWTTDGTTPLEVFSTAPFIPSSSLRLAGRVTHDIDNGAAGKTTTFYQGPSLAGPWTQLSQVTTAGTTSIFNSAADLRVGDVGLFLNFTGRAHALDLRAAIDSVTQVTNPDFTAQTTGTTSFTDTAGRVWTLNGGVSIPDTTPPWVTTAGQPAQFPFDILIGGERMTVTATSGAGSPQTFTVTRSVNGVRKSHAAGAAVQVADPFRLAL